MFSRMLYGTDLRASGKRGKTMKIDLSRLSSIVANGGYTKGSFRISYRAAIATGLLLSFCVLFCSGGSSTEAQAPKTPTKAAVQPAAPAGDDLPPAIKIPWKGDLDAIAKRRVLRVLVAFRRPEFFYMEGRPVGILQEAFGEIEKLLNAKYKTTSANRIIVALLPTPMDLMRERMAGGYGDIAASSISITEANRAIVDFTIPTMTGLKILAVTGPGAPGLKNVEDLSGQEVWVRPQSHMAKSLDDLNARLKLKGKAPAKVRTADSVLEPGDILELVNAGIYPIAVQQSVQAEFWAQVFDNVKVRNDLVLAEDVELGWAIQKGTPQLKAFLNDFIKTHGIGTAFGNTVLRRYLKTAKYVRNATEVSEMKKFQATVPYFKKYSAQYNLDYLMMAAQGYQESRLDQSVKSPVGAVGIMQVMPSTAAGAPVNVPGIEKEENNIKAGVRLMHFLIEDYFNDPGLDLRNRMLLAIASYNAGPAKITRCRKMAKDMGYDPNKWFNNVEVSVAKVVGRETTQYVANVYKYYLCYQLASDTLQRRQKAEKQAGKK
jgi:membrane-bound lytic murein transglycosylase MltF